MIDCSEFSDIFDVEHFKETLKDDVRIVSSLPSTHVMIRPVEEKHTPLNASPRWLRQHYQGKVSGSKTELQSSVTEAFGYIEPRSRWTGGMLRRVTVRKIAKRVGL